jgi:extradiol dioxygenase family protein
MTVLGIDHVQLAMPAGQESAAREFYSGLLGIPEVPKPAELAARGGVWFESSRVKLHLGVEKDFRPAKKAHPGLVIDDLEALAERLRAAGVATTADHNLADQARYFVEDPFGNRLELLQAKQRG